MLFWKQRRILWGISLILLALLISFIDSDSVEALNMSSTSYSLDAMIGNGVANLSSTSFMAEVFMNPLTAGNISSSSYQCEAGFLYIRDKQLKVGITPTGFDMDWWTWNGSEWRNSTDYWVIPTCLAREDNCTEIVTQEISTGNYFVIHENQTQPIFKIDNTMAVNNITNIELKLNSTCTDYVARAYDVWNTTGAINLTTAYQDVMFNASKIKPGQSLYLWLYFDVHNPVNQCLDWPDFFIQATWEQ